MWVFLKQCMNHALGMLAAMEIECVGGVALAKLALAKQEPCRHYSIGRARAVGAEIGSVKIDPT